jgi:hypothetical protein
MTAWSDCCGGQYQCYPGRAPAWHLERFREYHGIDVVIDDQLHDREFAIDEHNGVSFISAFLGSNKRLHQVITEVSLTLQFGAGVLAGTRELPPLPRIPRLIAADGKLVPILRRPW